MTKLGITREPGESEENFRRRYGREKMRLYRASKPKSDRVRGKGKAPLKNSNLTEAQWLELRQRPGEPDDEYRRRYQRTIQANFRARKGAEEMARRARELYAANGDRIRMQQRELRARHPGRQAEYDRRRREKNPEKAAQLIEALNQWGRDNRDRLAAAKKAWNAENRALLAHYSAKWRKAARIATPPWADMARIRAFYEEARRVSDETGVEHEVDHIVPLQGKVVCGLHVHTNLRVIPARANSRKRNRLDEALVEALHLDVL